MVNRQVAYTNVHCPTLAVFTGSYDSMICGHIVLAAFHNQPNLTSIHPPKILPEHQLRFSANPKSLKWAYLGIPYVVHRLAMASYGQLMI